MARPTARCEASSRHRGRGVLAIERLRDTALTARRRASTGSGFFAGRRSSPPSSTPTGSFTTTPTSSARARGRMSSLKDAIRRVDALGFNAIDFASLDLLADRRSVPRRRRRPHAFDVLFRGQRRTIASRSAAGRRPATSIWRRAAATTPVSRTGASSRCGSSSATTRFADRRTASARCFASGAIGSSSRSAPAAGTCSTTSFAEGASFIRDPSTLTPYDPDAVRIGLTLRHRGVEALEESTPSTAREPSSTSVRAELETARSETRSSDERHRAAPGTLCSSGPLKTSRCAAASSESARRNHQLDAQLASSTHVSHAPRRQTERAGTRASATERADGELTDREPGRTQDERARVAP